MDEVDTYTGVSDLASVERCWPVGHAVPQLILDMADLVAPWAYPSIGFATIKGSRFDDYWIELGGDLSEQFGNFIALPDGTHIAIWYHEGAARGGEPVIALGSEGDMTILAPNLTAFMTHWAQGAIHRELDPDPETATPDDLAQRQRHGAAMLALITRSPAPPASAPVQSLPKFIENWQKAALARNAADPVMCDILTLLAAHIPVLPPGADPATTYVPSTAYQIRIAGDRIEIQTPAVPPDYTSFQPLPERDALVPLILKAREARAQAFPGRGLWHDAMLELYEEKYLLLKASWEFEPGFREGGRMTKAELDADLARHPRSPRWRQPWMDELV